MTPPGPPQGSSPLAIWLKRLREYVLSLQISPGNGYRVRKTPTGTILELITSAGGGTPQGSGMNFRGEYDSDASYVVGDVVVIRTGVNAGSYVCVVASPGSTNPPTQPDTGNGYWVSLSNGNTVGSWL